MIVDRVICFCITMYHSRKEKMIKNVITFISGFSFGWCLMAAIWIYTGVRKEFSNADIVFAILAVLGTGYLFISGK